MKSFFLAALVTIFASGAIAAPEPGCYILSNGGSEVFLFRNRRAIVTKALVKNIEGSGRRQTTQIILVHSGEVNA